LLEQGTLWLEKKSLRIDRERHREDRLQLRLDKEELLRLPTSPFTKKKALSLDMEQLRLVAKPLPRNKEMLPGDNEQLFQNFGRRSANTKPTERKTKTLSSTTHRLFQDIRCIQGTTKRI
jgi:hypothetical protein